MQGCLTTYQSKTPFDLVLCHDVMQYLSDAEAEAGMRNLAALTRRALHFEILTAEDWEAVRSAAPAASGADPVEHYRALRRQIARES